METQHSTAASATRTPARAPEGALVQPQGLLLAFSDPPAGEEDAYNAWYEEHAAGRLTVPGIFNGRRYQAIEADGPRYMACYDLARPQTLKSPEYERLRREASQNERDMMARLPVMDRRELQLILGCEPWTDDAPYQLTVALEPAPGTRADFIDWYREEHIPMLLKVPGWRRARLFEQVEGSGPAFCALHELEKPDVFEGPEYEATRTPWREKVIGGTSRRERHLWKLLHGLPWPAWGMP
jgi:hypothetical protein